MHIMIYINFYIFIIIFSEALKQIERENEWKKIEQMAKANAEKMETEIKEPTMMTLIDNNLQGKIKL